MDARLKAGHDGVYVAALRPEQTRYSPSTALAMMLRWISFEPP